MQSFSLSFLFPTFFYIYLFNNDIQQTHTELYTVIKISYLLVLCDNTSTQLYE